MTRFALGADFGDEIQNPLLERTEIIRRERLFVQRSVRDFNIDEARTLGQSARDVGYREPVDILFVHRPEANVAHRRDFLANESAQFSQRWFGPAEVTFGVANRGGHHDPRLMVEFDHNACGHVV